ncbi:MAG: hypothetical protein ACLU9S_02475 [Oscillospiraceae bacterium]
MRPESHLPSDGYTGDTVCTVCGETLQVGQIIPATGTALASGP